MASVLIVGASKGIGLETARSALAAGHSVRALARSRVNLAHPGLSVVTGDATDPQVLARAVEGCDAVIQTLGFHDYFSPKPVTVFSRATRHLIAAMQAAGVKRLVAVTGLGTGDSRGVGNPLVANVLFPLVLGRIYEDKDVQESMIRASGLDWTIVRPGILTWGAATGRYRALTDPADWTTGTISRADVARFLVEQIEDGSLIGQTPLLIR